MRRRKMGGRFYLRGSRFYADLRDYSDVGGKQEALIPPGRTRATTDRDEAAALVVQRIKALKEMRKRGDAADTDNNPTFEDYARYHLLAKAHARRSATIERDERSLSKVLEFFVDLLKMPRVRLSHVTVERLTKYVEWRRVQPGRHGRTISAQTQLHELHALSNLFKRAVAEGKAVENPVQRLIEKPKIERDEAVYLEPGESARLLAVAKELDEKGEYVAVPFLYPLIATYLYTGGRPDEVRGLEIEDIDFERGVVLFRKNQWRQLKRAWSKRTVPLWPALHAALGAYIGDRREGLLFPARDGKMIRDFRSRLDAAVRDAQIEKRVTPKTFRHTYTATRLQTTDNGMPVSIWHVACELGHRDTNLIERTYGHLLGVRDRDSVVEYREAKVLLHQRSRSA